MAKRELINKKKLIRKMNQSNAFDISERMKFSNLIEQQRPITEQDIVKPYLEQIREEIMKLDDINPDYPMDRTIHISRNEVLQIINKYKTESEG